MATQLGDAAAALHLPFEYVGGDPSIDLVNTVDWTPHGLANERLTDYPSLTRWAEEAGLVSRREAMSLRTRARKAPRAAAAAFAQARELRAALQRLYYQIATGGRGTAAWEGLNLHLAAALSHLRVEPRKARSESERVARWTWRGEAELDSILWAVAWAAARLMVSDEAARIRVCAGPNCGWMYVDRSRNRLRRWCQMKTCGTTAKSRRRRERNLDARGPTTDPRGLRSLPP